MKKIPRTVAELDGQEINLSDDSYKLALVTDGVVRQVIGTNELYAAILMDPTLKAIPIDSVSIGDTLNVEE